MFITNIRNFLLFFTFYVNKNHNEIPFNSSMVTSLKLFFPKVCAASSQWRLLVGYSLPESVWRTLEFVTRIVTSGLFSGTNRDSIDLFYIIFLYFIIVLSHNYSRIADDVKCITKKKMDYMPNVLTMEFVHLQNVLRK